jgi:hypothetical protein
MLKSDAVRFGWLHVMLNTWQCWFCSHHPCEQLAIVSNYDGCKIPVAHERTRTRMLV